MNTRLLTPQDYWRVVTGRKWLIIITLILSLGIAWGVCLWLPKSYKSTTSLLAEGQKVPEYYVRGLDKGPQDQEGKRDQLGILRQIMLNRTVLAQIAQEFHVSGFDINTTSPEVQNGIIRGIRSDIGISMSKDGTFLTVSYSHSSPIVARDVTARLAELFINENLRDRAETAEGAAEFLEQELAGAKVELEVKERAIAQFKQAHLGELPSQMEANLRTLDRLQADMTAQNELAQTLNMRLASVEKAVKEFEDDASGQASSASPRRVKDARMMRIKELERSMVALSSIYKDTYPDIVQIKEEIKKLKEMSTKQYLELQPESEESQESTSSGLRKAKIVDPYYAELAKQKEDILDEIAAVKRRQGRITGEMREYQSRVDHTPEREQRLMVLIRDYENMQKNYQSLLEKKLNAGIAGNLERKRKGTQYHIIDPANLPVLPDKPNIPQVMLAGLGLGCALGVGGAILLELLGRGFRFPEEVEVALGLPVLASIPLYQSAFGGSTKSFKALPQRARAPALSSSHEKKSRQLTSFTPIPRSGNGRPKGPQPPTPDLAPGLDLVSMWRPRSFVAEQFRVAATRLELMGAGRKSTVVLITSAVMSEGKSSTALNLGYVLAKDLNRRTLVIDCDLKRPRQHVYAGISQYPGIAEILHNEKPMDECLHRLGEMGPWILPSGSVSDRSLGLSKMQQVGDLLADLRPKFEYMIVDAPPILPLADMHVLASMADVLGLVIRAGSTGRDVVQKAIRALGDANQIGIVLNGIDAQATPYYMQQEYYRESHHEQLK